MQAHGAGRAWLMRDAPSGAVHASDDWLSGLAGFLERDCDDDQGHEAVFLAVGPISGALFGAFLHRTDRGQTQGGLRRWPYPSLEAFLRDGLRLSLAMGRKNALAGLWWGGGKGLIAARSRGGPDSAEDRRTLYHEYGEFVSSLDGCYVTAEDAGTTPDDVAAVFERTRFATCIPPRFGGSGNPSQATARGVLCGLEAALEATGMGPLAEQRLVMQGLGHVGLALLELVVEAGAGTVLAGDISRERCRLGSERFSAAGVQIRHCEAGDPGLLFEPCDVLVPNALGGVITAQTIPGLRTQLVCGAANNPLGDEERDAQALQDRGIVYVPDFVVNRMGIVSCADEQFGRLSPDPAVERHLDRDFEHGIPAVTARILERAGGEGVTPLEAANRLADALCAEPHPIFGARAREILHSIERSDWLGRDTASRS
jgi:glutamate dehydrogenase/leucine dehydrogenase